ncbi:MAG: peroxiredoxin family protein [Candidatus Aminicenantales bacterium]
MKRLFLTPFYAILLALIFSAAFFFFSCGRGEAQEAEVRPVTVGQVMPNFSLPKYQGGTLSLADLKGKKVLLIFPRGFAAEGAWCTICHYRYAELLEIEQVSGFRKKYNIEVVMVFPYDQEKVEAWLKTLPAQLAKVKDWKYPADPQALDERGRQRMERAQRLFPRDLRWEEGKPVATPFPLLIDADRKVSKGLGLFSEEWGGSKVAQNIPAYFILDESGVVLFKYIGQNTADRPSHEYLEKVLDCLGGKSFGR